MSDTGDIMHVDDKLSIRRPMLICTNACVQGIRDSVYHNKRSLEIMDENGSYPVSRELRIEMLGKLLDELYINEMLIVNELLEINDGNRTTKRAD